MKSIFQEKLKASGEVRPEKLRPAEQCGSRGLAAMSIPPHPGGVERPQVSPGIQDRFEKINEPCPEINWKKLESKFHFARRKARRA